MDLHFLKEFLLKIYYLPHADVDKKKWDRCIDDAPNGLIYADSCYLDAMSKNWDAIVLNDYEAVMPLTWNKKFGIQYLRQPAFTQQLGIFGIINFTQEIIKAFLQKASDQFSFAEINLNYANAFKENTISKCNLILPLNNSFSQIEKSFKKDLIQNIKKAQRNNLIYSSSEDIENAISLYQSTYAHKFFKPQKDYEHFLTLCAALRNKGQLIIRKVNSAQGELLAMGLFLKDRKRIYKTMTTTLPQGRKLEANHLLLYELIREFSNQDLIFDFVGSEIPSIHSFLRKFGPQEQPYFFLKNNRLNPLEKWAKHVYDKYQLKGKK